MSGSDYFWAEPGQCQGLPVSVSVSCWGPLRKTCNLFVPGWEAGGRGIMNSLPFRELLDAY